MRWLAMGLLAIVIGEGTLFVGWWTVPVIGAIYALLSRHTSAPRESALAALLAWAALLARLKSYAAFGTLLTQLGQLFPIPGAGVAAFTLALGVVLAATAARVMIGVVGVREYQG